MGSLSILAEWLNYTSQLALADFQGRLVAVCLVNPRPSDLFRES